MMKKSKVDAHIRNKWLLVALSFGVISAAGWWVYTQLITSAQIALISGTGTGEYCTYNIVSFTALQSCGIDGYQQYKYSCTDSGDHYVGSTNTCTSFDDEYAKALATCGKICVVASPVSSATTRPPSPTPYQSPVPTSPLPSAFPSPRVSSTPNPSLPPACYAQTVSHSAYREICTNTGTLETQYHFLDYTCGSETAPRTIGSSQYCQFASSLLAGAQFYCRQNTCASPVSSPVASTAPISTPTRILSPIPVASTAPTISRGVSTYMCRVRCTLRYPIARKSRVSCQNYCK